MLFTVLVWILFRLCKGVKKRKKDDRPYMHLKLYWVWQQLRQTIYAFSVSIWNLIWYLLLIFLHTASTTSMFFESWLHLTSSVLPVHTTFYDLDITSGWWGYQNGQTAYFLSDFCLLEWDVYNVNWTFTCDLITSVFHPDMILVFDWTLEIIIKQ